MFQERKVMQIAVFFLAKTTERRMSHLKLMKLLYIADRKAVSVIGMPISGDCLVSMPHGPVLSMTLDLMNGNTKSQPGGWDDWISAKKNHEVSLRKRIALPDLDELSQSELQVLESVWNEFGKMDQWQIRDWTHHNCHEWVDPKGSSSPISYHSLARAIGFDEDRAVGLEAFIQSQREIDNIFADL